MMNLYSCIELIQHITQSMWGVKVWAMFVKRAELKSHLMMRVQYRDHYILWKKHVKYDLNSRHTLCSIHAHYSQCGTRTHFLCMLMNTLHCSNKCIKENPFWFNMWFDFFPGEGVSEHSVIVIRRDCWTHNGTLWVYFVCLSVFTFWHYEMFSCFHLARISVFLI